MLETLALAQVQIGAVLHVEMGVCRLAPRAACQQFACRKADPPTPAITVLHGASFKERSQMHRPSPPTGVVAQRCLINEGNQSKLVESLAS